MFPQSHDDNIISSGGHGDGLQELELEQMLHFLSSPSPNIPLLPTTPMDHRSRWKPNIEIAPNCPRCASTNTKFCYYNNYSLSQPRYFCKGCRRYWTKGGSLRNVPVGGGCRKTRRGKSSRNPLQNERLSSFSDGDDGNDQQNQNNNESESRDIDMALVFAKFLNQNTTSTTTTGEEFESEEANNGSSSSNNNNNNDNNNLSVETETENDAVVQPQNLEETTTFQVQNFGGAGDQELNLSGIDDEFEGFLGTVVGGVDGDHVVHDDVLWSSDHHANIASSNSNTWQPPPMMQMHDLEYLMPLNDQVSSSSTVNLISDSWSSWSSFDLSTMEVFSSSTSTS